MIIFDTETTGLIANEALPLDMQPRILEIGALRVNFQLEVEAEFSALVCPPGYVLSDEIREITGLSQEDLSRAKTFPQVVPALAKFFLGEETLLAHNLRFDLMMLAYELRRIEWQYRFPFPRVHIDTTEVWPGKLADWGKSIGVQEPQRHRALADCELLLACYRAHIGEQEGKWTR